MDYTLSFQSRAKNYTDAIKEFPSAFEEEFQIAFKMLDVQPADVLLNIPCGGIYLEQLIPSSVTYKKLEINEEFSNIENVPLCTLQSIPVEDSSITKVLTLACLHHTTIDERYQFYTECFRILKPDGTLVIGDVLLGSEQDIWLNQIVNKYNSKGHCGTFFTEKDADEIQKCGFNVSTVLKTYSWKFHSDEEMIYFFKKLMNFNLLDNLNILKYLLYKTFKIKNYCVEWKLLYFLCKKVKL